VEIPGCLSPKNLAYGLTTPVAKLIFRLVGQVMEKVVPLKVRGIQM
jgi:hypothetical protein